jgi:hypothetical protein
MDRRVTENAVTEPIRGQDKGSGQDKGQEPL